MGCWSLISLCIVTDSLPVGKAKKNPVSKRGFFYCADGGIRTPTGLCPLRPERSASASSATSAIYFMMLIVILLRTGQFVKIERASFRSCDFASIDVPTLKGVEPICRFVQPPDFHVMDSGGSSICV